MNIPPKKPIEQQTPANSIRLDSGRLNRFLDERDALSAENDNKPRRDYVRWPFRTTSLPLTVVHPGGSSAVFNVACRNLSSGGISVLHSAYMHKGTRCFLSIPRADGARMTVEGTIVRCSHMSGTIHEIGIQFLKPVDTKQFVPLDPFANRFSLETVDAEQLRGTVLYVEPSVLDQSLVRHYLRETQISLIVAAEVDEAIKRAGENVDLILCDYNLGNPLGSAFIARAREAGLSQPILIVTADTSASTRQELIKISATAYITKPIKQDTLFRAMAEFTMLGAEAGGISSTLPQNHANLGLLETFVDEIKQQAKHLETAMLADNVVRTRSICMQIAGSAPVMGFERLADLAKLSERALSSRMSISESAVTLRTLIGACQRISARRAA